MLVGIFGFVLVQGIAMGIGYKRGKIEGIQSSGEHLYKAGNEKFLKHMADLRKNNHLP
ncbi:hypothetical protein MKY29_03200 [Psychrobacillus sp. FSL K6-2365]|uniref:hypothetical protein n=1 Tax=Psychrobacillus sp. FSL K6-2365 TaxID=2921546 RepID=UPI0030FB34D1